MVNCMVSCEGFVVRRGFRARFVVGTLALAVVAGVMDLAATLVGP